ncbi:hypothetical protein [Actibacterium lipolyticum]|uniref:Uncharacterized protein n=1 Tax=Actibacterium lipolyticum TaxID=1524263 RepID=A0A238KT26_9RHOB|nr:hypothetical protein [Actibacterium lipolyticum]SMX45820.1 hypothetical protein COL8621_02899 [Actibacterium lipolyticum]
MTEITATTQSNDRYLVDPMAFTLSLFGAPFFVAVLGCILIIPIFALPYGFPFYLLIGTPILWWLVRRGESDKSVFAGWGFLGNLATPLLFLIWAELTDGYANEGLAIFLFVFGMLFAPLWALAFIHLYARLQRDFYKTPMQQGELI